MDKFSDNLSALPPGSVVTPTTVPALLRKLKLSQAPRTQQETAIAQWLAGNEPSELMVYSLRKSGFGGLTAGVYRP